MHDNYKSYKKFFEWSVVIVGIFLTISEGIFAVLIAANKGYVGEKLPPATAHRIYILLTWLLDNIAYFAFVFLVFLFFLVLG